jgi:hypothetical protein
MNKPEDRLLIVKESLLMASQRLRAARTEYKEACEIFDDLCDEKLRLETAIIENAGKVKKIPLKKPKISISPAEKAAKAKNEYDEVQALLRSLGLKREGGEEE